MIYKLKILNYFWLESTEDLQIIARKKNLSK